MKSYTIALLLMLATVFGINAQIVTTEPTPLQESSQNVVVYYHADQGNKGLINQPESDPIYAHAGVITSKSNGSWKYAPTWKDNSEKYKLQYVSNNLWKLNIGDIRTYYGITDPEEKVLKLAFVFRNATATKEGKTAEGGDIFVDVEPEGFVLTLTSNNGGTLIMMPCTLIFTASTTAPADLSISVNGTQIASASNSTSVQGQYNVQNTGEYKVKATAVYGGVTYTKEDTYILPDASQPGNYPGGVPKLGTVRQADGSVIFCAAGPQKNSAMLIGSWNGYNAVQNQVMKYHDYNGQRYFWTTVSGLDPDTKYPYYYVFDNTMRVGDPYAKLIIDPYNDKYIPESVYPDLLKYPKEVVGNVMLAVYWENINKYNWKVQNFNAPDPEDLIIYELLFRDFTGTEGQAKANGTVREAIKKIPYLKKLGVNAIELMPIMEFNGNNSWGYNTNFYFAPDKAYGTPDDYKEFIDLCHQNGMAVILDIVFNQSDGLHPWYQMYPIASNPFYNKTAPHAYSVLNDWNQDNPLVMQQWKDCVQYWLKEYKVDGFRYDLVKGLGDNNSYGSGTESYNVSRVNRMKAIHAAASQVNPKAYHINEHLAGAKEENEMAEDGQINWANINNSSCQYAMGYTSDAALNRFLATKDSRTWGSTVSYMESHDEERVAYKQNQWGVSGIKGNHEMSMRRIGSTAAQMILAPGAHMIWQFAEMGNDQTTKKSDGGNNVDPKIVNWSLLDNEHNAGLVQSFTELNWLRRDNPELFKQSAECSMLCTSNDSRWIYLSAGNKELILVVNPSVNQERTITTNFKSKNTADYKIASKSYGTNPTFDATTGKVTVPANGYVVLVNNNTVGVEDVFVPETTVSVFGGNGCINVAGSYSSMMVYTMSGAQVANNGLNAGMYIAVVDGKAYKVLVK